MHYDTKSSSLLSRCSSLCKLTAILITFSVASSAGAQNLDDRQIQLPPTAALGNPTDGAEESATESPSNKASAEVNPPAPAIPEPEPIDAGTVVVGGPSDFEIEYPDPSAMFTPEYRECSQPFCDGCNQCDGSYCDDMFPGGACWWAPRHRLFADYLLLRPGSTDVLYAIEQNDTTATGFPTGPTGISQVGFTSGYRIGLAYAYHESASSVASFTRWEGTTSEVTNRTGTNVLFSPLIHPRTFTTGGNSLQSAASESMNFSLVDLSRRFHLLHRGCTTLNWWAGIRYGQLEQNFGNVHQLTSVATGSTTVTTDIDFRGIGFRTGIDAQRHHLESGMMVYGEGFVSLLGGEWTGSYTQTNINAGGGVIGNRYEEFRITPVLEAELGLGWQDPSGRFRLRAGYTTSFWGNAIDTSSYIAGFRSGQLLDIDETISFIGLRSRLEMLY